MKFLPSLIHRLQKLKHLYITGSTIRTQLVVIPWQYLESLKNLQTLKGIFVDNYPDLVNGLDSQDPGIQRKRKGLGQVLGTFKKSKDLNKVLDEGLGKLINLRELKLELQLFLSRQVIVVMHVMKLKHLQSLQLMSYPIEESWEPLKLEP
ncbi:hypothetical protein SO802_010815 [Lithocarpus litseifolius]|uniref:Uncharacterized protein n=1 Tax=Lithocarpus litseifolius TaxID=425828 RepID=A0AAW2DHW3_9ROSI